MLHLQVIFGLIICFHGVNSADSLSEHCETDFTGMSRNDVIEHYFHKGFLHKEIYAVLRPLHAIIASVGILKHVLKNVMSSKKCCHSGRVRGCCTLYMRTIGMQ